MYWLNAEGSQEGSTYYKCQAFLQTKHCLAVLK